MFLLFVPRDPTRSVAQTARVLAALGSVIDGLNAYYALPEDERKTCSKGPYFCGGNSITLDCMKEMKNLPWLFEAKYDQEVVVKFVNSQYGEEVHRFLADNDLAPKLYLCEQLCGGWYAIIEKNKRDHH